MGQIRCIHREWLIWEGKKIRNHWERKERKNHCNLRIPTKERFSDYICGFVHRWIGLIFGQQFLHAWYLKLSGWIGKKISGERDKCFTLSALFFGILSSCLYCTNWGFVSIWLFVTRFSALVGGYLVSSFIIVKLFLWSGWPVIFILALRDFSR